MVGKTVHIPTHLHADLKIEAFKMGISLNKLVESKLSRPVVEVVNKPIRTVNLKKHKVK